jgi:hypothetical protein
MRWPSCLKPTGRRRSQRARRRRELVGPVAAGCSRGYGLPHDPALDTAPTHDRAVFRPIPSRCCLEWTAAIGRAGDDCGDEAGECSSWHLSDLPTLAVVAGAEGGNARRSSRIRHSWRSTGGVPIGVREALCWSGRQLKSQLSAPPVPHAVLVAPPSFRSYGQPQMARSH